MNTTNVRECPGCRVVLPITNYPAENRYGVFSPECRELCDAIMARESELFGYPPAHRLVVDAGAVQHPPHYQIQQALGIEKRFVDASIQSVAIHLIALYLALEKKIPLLSIASIMSTILTNATHAGFVFPGLTPPIDLGAIKINDVYQRVFQDSLTLEEYTKIAYEWADSAWHAWSQHHDTIKQWYARFS